MFDFIHKELIEARLFRSPISLEGHTTEGLARILYVSLLAIEIIRQEDEDLMRRYAAMTTQYGDFDHMRSGVSDVGNLIAVLGDQSKYEDNMKINHDITAPMLQIKTYLRGVWLGVNQHTRDRQFFMSLENALKIHDSTFSQVRRTVLDWKTSDKSERQQALANIRRELNRHATRLDILQHLPNS